MFVSFSIFQRNLSFCIRKKIAGIYYYLTAINKQETCRQSLANKTSYVSHTFCKWQHYKSTCTGMWWNTCGNLHLGMPHWIVNNRHAEIQHFNGNSAQVDIYKHTYIRFLLEWHSRWETLKVLRGKQSIPLALYFVIWKPKEDVLKSIV